MSRIFEAGKLLSLKTLAEAKPACAEPEVARVQGGQTCASGLADTDPGEEQTKDHLGMARSSAIPGNRIWRAPPTSHLLRIETAARRITLFVQRSSSEGGRRRCAGTGAQRTVNRHPILTPCAGVCSRPAAKRGAIWRSAARSRRAHRRRGRLKLCS